MLPKLATPVKVTLISATVGIALIGVLAAYFRRRKRPRPRKRFIKTADCAVDGRLYNIGVDAVKRYQRRQTKSPISQLRSPNHQANGDIPGSGALNGPGPALQSTSVDGSITSTDTESSSASTVVTLAAIDDMSELSPQQLCELGMDALQNAATCWEEGIEKLDNFEGSEYNPAIEQLQEQLSHLLEQVYRIQEYYEQRLFSRVNTSVALDAALLEMDKEYTERRHRRSLSIDTMSSDQESFVSALDIADLSDLEDQQRQHQELVLYESALLLLKHGSVPCRTLRTRMLNCSSDSEFLAKLHCVRLAFQELFRDETIRNWFAETGREMISNLLVKAERDAEDFQAAFDEMLKFVQDTDNWPSMEEELRGRGVKMLTFYDIVIDFILFDAFDDLENPPSSVTTVVQNRWLSNGFKETALATAVWSVLKAKRRLLKFSKGFIAHFYAISEHVSPVLAWGFLGPTGTLRDLCYFFKYSNGLISHLYKMSEITTPVLAWAFLGPACPFQELCLDFKDEIQGFMRDVFSFSKARYTTVEELSDDILRLARERMTKSMERLS